MRYTCFAFSIIFSVILCFAYTTSPAQPVGPRNGNPWIGLTTKDHKSAQDVDNLIAQVQPLAAKGVNVLIYEVDYSFEFQTHPELRHPYAVPKAQIRRLSAECRKYGVRLVPLFNCFGHQSIEDDGPNLPLIAKYPEFDETPGKFPNNSGVYARCWCPLAPGLNRIVFDLLREIAEAFEADAVHLGMDEIFHVGLDARCKGRTPASLVAQAINTYAGFVRDSLKAEAMLWGDRLIPESLIGHEWEASANKTAAAVDSISKDIIICDWHYETSYSGVAKGDYPTVPYFTSRGFRVWPCGFQTTSANKAMIDYVFKNKGDKVLGYLASVWESTPNSNISKWEPVVSALAYYGSTDASPPGTVVLHPPTAAGATALRLTWEVPSDPQSGIAGYEIYRDSIASPTRLLTRLAYNVPAWTDSNLATGKRFTYTVKAINRKGLLSAEYSNEVSAMPGTVAVRKDQIRRDVLLDALTAGEGRTPKVTLDGRRKSARGVHAVIYK